MYTSIEYIKEIVEESLRDKSICDIEFNDDTDIRALGLDSLDWIDFQLEMESKFEVDLDDLPLTPYDEIYTFKELVDNLNNLINK